MDELEGFWRSSSIVAPMVEIAEALGHPLPPLFPRPQVDDS
jgi:hypothetical protein